MRHAILGLLFFLFIPVAAWSISVDPSDIGVGARPLGMGKAFVGQVNDASSLFLNPSGLSDIENMKFISMSGRLLQEADYFIGGIVNPFSLGVFGISYASIGVGNIPLTTLNGTLPASTGISADYANKLIILSYAREFGNGFSFGSNFKYFSQAFTGGGVSLEGGTGTGLDMDFGLQWEINDATRWGILFQNVLPSSAGGKFVWQKNNREESIPCLIKLGGYFNVLGEKGYYHSSDQNLDILIDTDFYYSLKRPEVWHVGVEWWPKEILALRTGIDQKPSAGNGVDNNLTFGVGIKFGGFTFDYAYHKFSDIDENAAHFFSLGYVGIPPEYKTQKKNLEFNPVLSLNYM